MKILIFNWRDITHPSAGGSELFIHQIAERLIKKGHQVTLFCGNHQQPNKQDNLNGLKIIRKGGTFSLYLLTPLYYLAKLRNSCDVIIDTENGIPFFTPLYSRKPKICLVHHIHKKQFFKEFSYPLALFGYFLETKLMPLVYRNINFITVSKSSLKELRSLGFNKDNIKIIHNGIDHNFYKPDFSSKSSYPHLVCLGRIKKYKSLDILIKAMKKVVEQVPDVKLSIVGDGDNKKELEKLVEKLNLKKHINFRGFVSEEKKREFLQRSWVAVNPSFNEGWGVTSIEANACGTPVIASDVEGLRDSVIDGKTGYLFDYGDHNMLAEKIVKVLNDEHKREKFSINAIKWADNFDWNKSADEFEEIILSL
ncbi:MAG: glycosyltransferase family 4 protein [Candidatus Pacebacteria bacterium]|nr:glycosyltransferase family 4 protein [Candidatus Paceibacterota bacterium]